MSKKIIPELLKTSTERAEKTDSVYTILWYPLCQNALQCRPYFRIKISGASGTGIRE